MKYDSSRIIFESESESQNLEKKFVGIHSWGKHIPSGLWASNKPPLFGVVWGQHADHRVRVISSWEIFGGTCPACHLLPQSSKNHPRCSMVAWYTYLHENHPKSTLYVSIGRYTNRPMEPIGRVSFVPQSSPLIFGPPTFQIWHFLRRQDFTEVQDQESQPGHWVFWKKQKGFWGSKRGDSIRVLEFLSSFTWNM